MKTVYCRGLRFDFRFGLGFFFGVALGSWYIASGIE